MVAYCGSEDPPIPSIHNPLTISLLTAIEAELAIPKYGPESQSCYPFIYFPHHPLGQRRFHFVSRDDEVFLIIERSREGKSFVASYPQLVSFHLLSFRPPLHFIFSKSFILFCNSFFSLSKTFRSQFTLISKRSVSNS